MIKNLKIARKAGFSAGLDPSVLSGRAEATKYTWDEDARRRRRLLAAFYGSFKQGCMLLMKERRETQVKPYTFPHEDYKLLFK